ncbi:lipoprotein NlpA [Superficieibacter sp.]|uniref:lipoprotein NlpA n=1 Tax=Superficieibacter sp. TaxID=2303322 RepID=UPI0028A63222|nr:lipoprotein NlpA [Superficieibacter sp.]
MKFAIPHLRSVAALLLAGLVLAGCDGNSSDAKHIKVGVINGAEQDVAEVAKKVAKEKYDLDVELVGFSGSLLPNDPTANGELDANVFQHRPFLAEDNKAHNYKLVAVANTFVFPMAGYSKKIKAVADLKQGDTVAIPNDPTNLGRALLLLEKEKLITLKPNPGLLPTALDITANPLNLNIMELEGAQLPRVLDDPKVTVAIISTTYIQQTGLSPVHDSVFIEDKNSPYVNIIVTREDNKDAENVRDFIHAYQSPEVATAAEKIFNGGAVPGWE